MKRSSLAPGIHRCIAAMMLLVVTLPSTLAAAAFSKIVVFGDSINDHGNMVEFTGGVFPAPPDYSYGRQSNGRLWVEYIADHLNLTDSVENYAVVGAMTKPAPGFLSGNVWSTTFSGLEGTDVATQVADYLRDANGQADPSALYILEGGSNDFPRVANPAIIVTNLFESLITLQAKGARHIILATLPDIGKTPRVILGERFGALPPGTAAYISFACSQLNEFLIASLPAYTAPGVTVTLADTYAFMNETSVHPARYGLVDVTQPYLVFGNGKDATQWLYWDDLHPTTRGHEIFAGQVVESLVRAYSPGKGRIGKGSHNSLNGLVQTPAP